MKNYKLYFNWLVLLIAWGIFGIFLALKRSLWGDEIYRLSQSYLPLLDGLISLFEEPSPFAPGEILLNWISKNLFNNYIPVEVWSRIPSLFFGLATIYVGHLCYKINNNAKYISLFLIFSVSFSMLSIQMRSYSSLIFLGAVSTYVLLNKIDRIPVKLVIISILFGNMFGVCYLCFALVIQKKWILAILGVFWIVLCLSMVNISPLHDYYAYPDWISISKSVLFVLSNPSYGKLILFSLFSFGLFHVFYDKITFKILLLLIISTLGPITIILYYKYNYALRHVAGGIFPFLFLCSSGLVYIEKILEKKIPRFFEYMILIILILTSFYPWYNAFILNHQRPLVDQPIHRFEEISNIVFKNNFQKILLLNPCHIDPVIYYLAGKKLINANMKLDGSIGGVLMKSWSFENKIIKTPISQLFCKSNIGDRNNFELHEKIKLILSSSFDIDFIIYDQINLESNYLKIPAERAW